MSNEISCKSFSLYIQKGEGPPPYSAKHAQGEDAAKGRIPWSFKILKLKMWKHHYLYFCAVPNSSRKLRINMVNVKVGSQVYLGPIRIYKQNMFHSTLHLLYSKITIIQILSQILCDNVEMTKSRLSKTWFPLSR